MELQGFNISPSPFSPPARGGENSYRTASLGGFFYLAGTVTGPTVFVIHLIGRG